jgi:transposase-like protein
VLATSIISPTRISHIESVHRGSEFREGSSAHRLSKAVRVHGHFPSDDAASKLLFLVLREVSQNWKMAPREWNAARTQFAVIFGDASPQSAVQQQTITQDF